MLVRPAAFVVAAGAASQTAARGRRVRGGAREPGGVPCLRTAQHEREGCACCRVAGSKRLTPPSCSRVHHACSSSSPRDGAGRRARRPCQHGAESRGLPGWGDVRGRPRRCGRGEGCGRYAPPLPQQLLQQRACCRSEPSVPQTSAAADIAQAFPQGLITMQPHHRGWGRYTDDTQMTVALARSIVECGGKASHMYTCCGAINTPSCTHLSSITHARGTGGRRACVQVLCCRF